MQQDTQKLSLVRSPESVCVAKKGIKSHINTGNLPLTIANDEAAWIARLGARANQRKEVKLLRVFRLDRTDAHSVDGAVVLFRQTVSAEDAVGRLGGRHPTTAAAAILDAHV